MGWLVSAATISPAQAAPAKPIASPGHPVRGVAFSVTGKLTTKVARPVELQRKSGSKWVKVAATQTTSSGRYSFSATVTVSSSQLRVYAPKTKIGKKTYPKLTSKVNTVRTVAVTPSSPMAGETFTVVESLGKKGARPASLQRRSGSSWVTLQTVTTSAAGTATFSTSLSGSASLRVYAPKTKIKKKTYSKITVATFQVAISAQSGTMSLPPTGITGQALVAETQFTPARAGRTVELQQLNGASWVTVATSVQDANGEATLGVAPSGEGILAYRAISTAYQGAPAVSTSTSQATITSGVAEPSIVIGSLAPAVTGEDYDVTLDVVGGTGPFTWTASGLPEGMSLSSDGVLSGTPTTPGTYDITLSLTDARGKTAQTTTQIVVRPVVGIESDSLPEGIAGQDYTATVTASGGTTPYRWTADGLPAGLTISDDGVISGATAAAGASQVTVTVTDANAKTATKEFTLTTNAALALTTTSLPAGTVGVGYSATLAATGGASPYTWSQTGLPAGLSLNATTGAITGTPTQAGTFDAVTITATDDNDYTVSATFSIEIAAAFAITTATLPNAVVDTAYAEIALETVAGTAPFTWSQTGLPAGLSLDAATGVVSGTPTEAGTFDAVTISVTDANSKSAQAGFTLTVAPAVHITTTTLPNGVVGTGYPETSLAAADGNGSSYFWDATNLPDGLVLNGNTGVISGIPTTVGQTDNIVITVTDGAGKTADATLSITIGAAVRIATTSLPNGVAGTQYTQTTLEAADGNGAPYTWASTTLPDGLSLSEAGVITGTPTSVGIYDAVKITVTDARGATAEATFTVTIAQAVHITTASLPAGVSGTAYAETTLAAADGTAPYTWSATGVPNGLTLSSAGVLSGTPSESGEFTVTVTVTDHNGKTGQADFDVTIAAAVSITTTSLPDAVVGTTYAATVAATGGTTGYTWASADLPAGLSLNASTGELTGTPTTAGAASFTVTVSDGTGKTDSRELTLTVRPAVNITTTSLPSAVVGTDYSATLTAADGNDDSYFWTSDTLPAGLSLNGNTGVLAGTPTEAGTFDAVKITVTDAAGATAEATFTITVAPAVHITTAGLPAAVVGTSYTATIEAADGTAPYTWTATSLPSGLVLSEDGTISGTPSQAGSSWVSVTVTDSNGKKHIRDLQLVVTPAVHITTSALADAVVDEVYPEATLTAADGTAPYTWAATGLPAGVSLDANTGVLSGTPTESGTFNAVEVTVTDDNGKTDSVTFALTVHAEISVTTATLNDAIVGESYSATLSGLGGTLPYTWTIADLPEGLALNSSTGEISGIPTTAGTSDLDVTLTDDHVKVATATLTLTVRPRVSITTGSLTAGVVGTDYHATVTASGGTAPYSWSASNLPLGLSVDTAGQVGGTPTESGTRWVTFTVTDAHGTTDVLDISMTINPALHITTTSLPTGVVDTAYSATLTAADGNGSVTWSATALPSGLSLDAETGELTGTPESAGSTTVTFTATDALSKTATWETSLQIVPAVHVTTTSLPDGVVGTEYTATLTSADGHGPMVWSATDLPAGLSLDSNTGVISGIPTTAGTTEVTFSVHDQDEKTENWTFSIVIAPAVHITTDALPSVEAGDVYPATTLTAADGTPGYTWTSTALPAGLTLSEAGVLSGTPTTDGTTAVTFTVTDHNGKTATAELSITITAAAHLTSTLAIGVIGGDYTTTLTADGGTAPYTITAGTLPDGLAYADGTISGTPTTAVLNTPVEFTITDGRSKVTTTTLALTVAKPVTESSGSAYACAVTPTGGVECWGNNTTGQLGDGTTTNSLYPVKVSGLDGTAISIATGVNHTCALLSTGKIQCWGYNNYGQLGNGTGDPSSTPVDVVDIDNAISITSGQTFSCATLSNGTATCWGIGTFGQLGNGGLVSVNHPVAVNDLTEVMDVQAGMSHACAVTTAGSVSCWGRNNFRQLGAGIATSTSSTPVAVPDVSGVIDLSAHVGNHTCVATDAGAVKCWGQNSNAQVGTTPATSVAAANTVSDVTDATQVTVGTNHSCAITSTGAVRCWGGNTFGQLGTNASGTMSASSFAIDLGATAASASAGANFTCARSTTGTVLCWGYNYNGQLANGYAGVTPHPLTIPALSSGFSTIAVGDGFSCGLTTGGGVKCWGGNSDGQLGDGTTTNSIQPVQVSGLDSGVAAIDLGTSRACALTTSGGVKCWGNNSDGALGIDTFVDSSVPVTPVGLSEGVVSVSTADRSTCAVLTDGTARCWGENGAHQLGDGSTITRTTPVPVFNLTDAASISVGAFHACAITTSGGLKCWGGNGNGTVGDGTTTAAPYPVNVSGLSSGVTAVTAGLQTTCAVVNSAVQCWGYNPFGQVGDGTTTDVLAPITVPGLSSGMADVRTGTYHVCALTTSGAVSCWGLNSSNQLGDGTMIERHTPTPVVGLSGAASSISVGGNSSCTMLTDGTVQCWGSNTNGQLGIRTAYDPTPAPVSGFNVASLAAGTASLSAGVVGTAYTSGSLTATGGIAPYTWTATGLPAGLSINADGSLTGTPTADGTSEVTFTVTDVRGKTDTTTASIIIGKAVHITTDSLPSVEAGDAYPETTLTAADGTPGYTWTSTALPAGLSLSEAGVLSGTPTADGTTAVTFTVTDSNGKTATAELSITITAAAHLTNTALSIGVVGGDYTTTLTASGGTAPYTYAATTLPTGLTLTDGVISGTPTAAGTNTPVELTITDAHSKTATTTLGLTVVEPKTETGGNATTCAITPTGGIECWGLNSSGQLGDGTTTNRLYPVAVTDLGGKAISVSTGLNHTCALLSNGKIRCWGTNTAGQLGTGDTTASLTPTDVIGIDSAVSVAAGQSFTCATLRDGTASCWGLGTSGQIGNGSLRSVSDPTAVNDLTNLMDVEAGGTHACALTTSGMVSCWGRNQYRQVGAGGTAGVTTYNAPVAVPDVSEVVSLSAHMGAFTCAATNTGAVKCWGNNSTYQLGSTSVTTSGDALTVPDVTDAVTVIVGGAHACAINAAGATRCWGYNASGQLGDGSIGTNSATPVLVSIADPATGAAAGTSHTCARTTTGTINCWGGNASGQLGNGYSNTQPTPLSVPALNAGLTSVSGGTNFSCALNSSGEVLCWGTNGYGQLGNGTTTNSYTPTLVSDLGSGVTDLAVGSLHACAVTAGGGVKCWGRNDSGQLGDETLDVRWAPVDVHGLSSGVIAISAGSEHTCALTNAGAVQCWGDNSTGQLGDDTSTDRPTPVEVYGLSSGVTAISAGGYHTCALVTGGGARCWGSGSSGELGNGTASSDTPVVPTGMSSGVATISAGLGFTCAVTDSGAAKCWGSNGYGQIGDGTTTNRSAPADVSGLASNAAAITAGGFHTCAATTTGDVKCWGNNASGQLGNGLTTTNATPNPVDVVGLTEAIGTVDTGEHHTCAITSAGGGLLCWGSASQAQLGLFLDRNPNPAPVTGFNVAAVAAGTVSLSAGVVGTAYTSGSLTATGGIAPYTWTATGLPAGLGVGTDGTVSGTPTEAGTTEVTFTVTDVRGKTDTTTASITITPAVHITSDAALPGGVVGTAYSTQLTAADGTGPYTWSSDVVPAGLTLSQDGLLSGTPTATTPSTTMQITATDHNGKTDTKAFTIVITPVIQGVAALSGSPWTGCVITGSGGLECWGRNDLSQLGNGSTTDSHIPVAVSGLTSGVQQVVGGASHGCALTEAGGVKCWGTNQLGQLGDGSPVGLRGDSTPYRSATPVDVVGLTSGVKAISAGANHTCAVTNAGAVKCWGYNVSGQLGNNSSTDSNTPVDVANLSSGVVAVSGSNASTCALTSAGTVMCWGSNQKGQLGNNSTTDSPKPVTVSGLSSVSSISTNGRTACALTSAGGVSCWGYNGTGQLGNDSTTDSPVPVAVSDLSSGVKQIATGVNHACAVTDAGGLTCWGGNAYGELGNDSTTDSHVPVNVSGLTSGVVAANAGNNRACALTTTGFVKCWGTNTFGQIGNGTTATSLVPVDVFGYGPVALRVATSGLRVGEVGISYPETAVHGAGGTAPYTWAATGLPSGLSIDAGTGVISGTPTEAGTFNAVKVTLTDATDATVETTLSLTTIVGVRVTTSSLPDGLVGTGYPATTVAAADGAAPYVWSATGLPAGLSLDAGTGEVTGTPTAYGVFSVAITATDQNQYAATTTVPLTVLAIAGVASDFLSIEGGSNQTCAVNNVGGVECWGNNAQGQLGNGTTALSLAPVNVSGLSSGATSVTTANNFSCALTSTGGVKCWGNNTYGQLGNNSTTTSTTPVDVTGLTSGVTAITTGNSFACALTSAGGVKCWGFNTYGQLGNDSTTASSTPVDVSGLTSGVTAITTGANHVCAVTSAGVKCWGYNSYGQLGNNTTTDAHTPVDVTGLTSGVTAITSGALHTCAVVSGGAKCWGYNPYGQLGNNTTTDAHTPVDVTGLTSGVTAITGGNNHACALTTTGGVKCWGNNAYGQLGNNNIIESHTPVDVAGLASGATAVTAGANHTCVVTSGHDVACWGANLLGQLGNGQRSEVLSPITPTGLGSGVAAAASGYNHTCALTSGGGVKCWGANGNGQLGNNTTTASSTAVDVSGLTSGVTAVAGGGSHTCALTTTGGVKCWGANGNGQLGNNTTTDSSTPVDVTGLASGVTAIAAGGSHTCALTTTGGIKCWGNNFAGAVGDATTNDRYTPVDVTGLTSGVTAITAGGSHTCALTTTGGVKCWGYNEAGELGDTTTTSSTTPVDTSGLPADITAVDAGGSTSCALSSTSGVRCWGYNASGQLGNGGFTSLSTPVSVNGLSTGVTAINVGGYHACALTSTGTKCWGQGSYGQLGNGGTTNSATPVDVTGLASGLANISAGNQHTCAVTTIGGLTCWGSNALGQVGNGDFLTLVPGAVVGHTFTPTATPLSIATVGLSSGTVSSAYSSAALVGTGGVGPYSWSATNLPAGITLSSAGVWGGTPTTAGSTNVTITATDTNANTASTTLSLTINAALAISTTSLSDGIVGSAYTSTALAATGGIGSYTWSATGLPAGITLSPAGVWGGAPTAASTASVTLTVTDTGGHTINKTLSLTVTSPVTITVTTSSLAAGLKNADYHPSGVMAATGGTAPYTWAATNLPPGITLHTDGTLSGIPTSSGTWNITFTATDSAAHSGTRVLSMTVGTNGPPA